jgi:hypothetical protein
MQVHWELIQSQALFFELHWNTFLHAIVGRVVTLLLECNDSEVGNKLIQTTQLHERMAEVGVEDINSFESDGYTRRGYMGFVVLLTGALCRAATVNEEMNQILQQSEIWKSYVEGNYATGLEIESRVHGGAVGAESSEDEDGDAVVAYQHTLKRDFENDFPKNFSLGDFEDATIDSLFHPEDAAHYQGIICAETGVRDIKASCWN